MDPVIIIATDAKGCGRYEAHVGVRCIAKSSRTPFLGAARALLAEGHDPRTRIVMRRTHDGIERLTSTVGKAARLNVYEGKTGLVHQRSANGIPRLIDPFARPAI